MKPIANVASNASDHAPVAALPAALERVEVAIGDVSLSPRAPVAPADRNPAAVYLAGLGSEKSRRSMRSALALLAAELGAEVEVFPWASLRYAHVAALRARLAARLSPSTVNHALSALRGVMREASRLGLCSREDAAGACDVSNVKGSREPAGRALAAEERIALAGACNTSTPAGARDAALLALALGTGMRRAELAGLTLAAVDLAASSVRIIGKGNRERTVYLAAWALAAVRAWLAIRGSAQGPLLARVNKGGHVDLGGGPMSDEAIRFLLARLASRAGVGAFSPHDARRSFVSELLDAGADISTVQKLAGHAQVTTTQRYDRRGERAKRGAVSLLADPFAAAR